MPGGMGVPLFASCVVWARMKRFGGTPAPVGASSTAQKGLLFEGRSATQGGGHKKGGFVFVHVLRRAPAVAEVHLKGDLRDGRGKGRVAPDLQLRVAVYGAEEGRNVRRGSLLFT